MLVYYKKILCYMNQVIWDIYLFKKKMFFYFINMMLFYDDFNIFNEGFG